MLLFGKVFSRLRYNYHDIEMRLKADRKFHWRSIPFCRRLIVFHQTFFLCCWLEWRQSLLPLAFPREFPDPVPASSRNTAFVLLLKSMKMAFQSWADLSKGLFQFTLGGVGWDGGRTRSKNNTNIGWSLYTKLPQTPLQQNTSSIESNTYCSLGCVLFWRFLGTNFHN